MKRKFYQTEILECFDKPYVKVYLNSLSYIEPVQELLFTLLSVRKANISDSSSNSSLPKNLTVYPKKGFSAQEVEMEIQQVLDNHFVSPSSNEINDVRKVLDEHPKALEQYNSAIQKVLKGENDRNAIDDMRLAWDILVGDLTGKQASPNKQESEIGKLLKDKGVAPELRNMFFSMVRNYADYQDKNVKHDINISHGDVLFVLNITNAFIKRIMSNN